MDRCALFVDAGYVLADGAMAVHGTRHRDSVSWDYAGLLKLLASLARDHTGQPVLRCYWYEATVDSRRTSEHEALAELPGLKLRLGKMRPGRREGVEADIHRDLGTLARNHAVSDAVIVSAEEDLAQVVAEAQDLGVRVTVVDITMDGNRTIPAALRQESDDIAEISSAHLRPFVDLIPGAEPAQPDDYQVGPYPGPGLPVGRGQAPAALTHQGLPAAALPAAGLPAPAAIYSSPVQPDYQRSAQPAASVAEPGGHQAAQAAQVAQAGQQGGPGGGPRGGQPDPQRGSLPEPGAPAYPGPVLGGQPGQPADGRAR